MCAVILLFILRYNSILGWPEGLVIGSILSATDPVAVVALLKELGTPINFNILLEGESLLNDGTATVFFTVFYSWIELGNFSDGEFFHKFFRLALGGPLFGILIALISYPILKRIIKHENLFVLSTVLITYFTFYMAESAVFKIHVSGILAVVALGIYFSFKLKNRVIGTIEESMHVVWHFLAYVFESLLFLLTGGFLGVFFIGRDADGLKPSILNTDVLWKLLVFQILLFLLRGVCLLSF